MGDFINSHYHVTQQRISVIPNYVNTDLFQPLAHCEERKSHLCFIGRLEKQKNVDSLLDALQGLDVSIDIIGSGSLEKQLRNKAHQAGLAAQFLGNLPHPSLPEFINRAALYIQPSLYEGHPKTILEAMACGKAVIGGDSPGTREVIQHGVMGGCAAPRPARYAKPSAFAENAPFAPETRRKRPRLYLAALLIRYKVIELETALYQKLLGFSPFKPILLR
jgi:glycosyltransferase involved in cell wall biosynthesis